MAFLINMLSMLDWWSHLGEKFTNSVRKQNITRCLPVRGLCIRSSERRGLRPVSLRRCKRPIGSGRLSLLSHGLGVAKMRRWKPSERHIPCYLWIVGRLHARVSVVVQRLSQNSSVTLEVAVQAQHQPSVDKRRLAHEVTVRHCCHSFK